jgi:hypothetical protein
LSSRPTDQQWNGDPLGTVGDEAVRAVAMESQWAEMPAIRKKVVMRNMGGT